MKYWITCWCFWCSLGFVSAQEPFICEGQFFLTLTAAGTSSLYEVTIDELNGQVVFDLVNSLGEQINSAGYRSTDNLIYGIHPTHFDLFQVDQNGTANLLTNLPLNPIYSYFAGDITPDGRYLVLVGASGGISDGIDEELVLVDLEDPNFNTTSFEINGPSVRMFDIAFDPTSGVLYGFDSNNDRLVHVDFNTGLISTPFASTTEITITGSLFFNAFGQLFAYGSTGAEFEQNTFFRIDKFTGNATVATTGPLAEGTDACSCPYTVEMSKTVHPQRAYNCDEVRYTFTIANASGEDQNNIDFEDFLPPGFILTEVTSNPFGGDIQSPLGTEWLSIENMTIPVGIDSIVVKAKVEDVASGVYGNQAVLSNLPPALGGIRLSDNPLTVLQNDSTFIEVIAIDFDTITVQENLCGEALLELDLTGQGASFLWDDGSTAPIRTIDATGIYAVEISAGCDQGWYIYEVQLDQISIFFEQEQYTLELGDSLQLQANLSNLTNTLSLTWTDPQINSLSCLNCPDPIASPSFTTLYTLTATNEFGCSESREILVEVDRDRNIYVPNVFSPNEDGINDVFYIQGHGFGIIHNFQIFDRWGGLLFTHLGGEINSDSHGWNGRSEGKLLNTGIYVWMAEIEFLDGQREVFSGDVLLMR